MTITELIDKLQELKKWHGGNPEVYLSCESLEKGFDIEDIIPNGEDVVITIIE